MHRKTQGDLKVTAADLRKQLTEQKDKLSGSSGMAGSVLDTIAKLREFQHQVSGTIYGLVRLFVGKIFENFGLVLMVCPAFETQAAD